MDRTFTFALLTVHLVEPDWDTTDAVSYTTTLTSWGERVHLTTTLRDRVQIRAVGSLLEGVVPHAEAGTWRHWLVHGVDATGAHHAYWLNELLSLLDIVRLEVGYWNRIACDILVHDGVIIATSSWLRNLLGQLIIDYLATSWLLLDLLVILTTASSGSSDLIFLLLLEDLDPLELLLELGSLGIDILVKELLVLRQLVNNILLIQLGSGGATHRCVINAWVAREVHTSTSVLAEETLALLETHGSILLPPAVW